MTEDSSSDESQEPETSSTFSNIPPEFRHIIEMMSKDAEKGKFDLCHKGDNKLSWNNTCSCGQPHFSEIEDPLCKYSPLKNPDISIHGNGSNRYTFATPGQFTILRMNNRFRRYLKNEFPDGGEKYLLAKKNRDNDPMMLRIRQKIRTDYLKAHVFKGNSKIDLKPNDVTCLNEQSSWSEPDDMIEVLERNYFTRKSKDSKCYFRIVYDRFLLTFLEDDGTYQHPKIGRYNEPIFSLNCTGLRDYDVLALADQCTKNVPYSPLSNDFDKKFMDIFRSHYIYASILNLGIRVDDLESLRLIKTLDSQHHYMGQKHPFDIKRYLFYQLLFFHPDDYTCDFRGSNFKNESYYGSTAEFNEICKIFSSNDYDTVQDICTKHRYLYYLTAKRVFYFEGLYPEYYKDKRLYPYIDHLAHNCKLGQPVVALAKFLKNKLTSNERLKGEFIHYFEKYLRKCLLFIMSDVKNMLEFYLWYRDSKFYLDWKGGEVNFKEYVDFEEFICPRFIGQDNHFDDCPNTTSKTIIAKYYDEIIGKIENHCRKDDGDQFLATCPDKNWFMQKFSGKINRLQAVLFSVLISIGRTMDILSISVTKSDTAKQKFKNMWSRDATLDEMDPLYDVFRDNNFNFKKKYDECIKVGNEGTELLKKVYPGMPYNIGAPILKKALGKYKYAGVSNLKAGSFLATPSYNSITCISKIYDESTFVDEHMEESSIEKILDVSNLYEDICYVRCLNFELSILNVNKQKGYFKSMHLLGQLIDNYDHAYDPSLSKYSRDETVEDVDDTISWVYDEQINYFGNRESSDTTCTFAKPNDNYVGDFMERFEDWIWDYDIDDHQYITKLDLAIRHMMVLIYENASLSKKTRKDANDKICFEKETFKNWIEIVGCF